MLRRNIKNKKKQKYRGKSDDIQSVGVVKWGKTKVSYVLNANWELIL